MEFRLKRVYESPSEEDGFRILVDRLWPRGLSKDDSAIDLWFPDIAPSNELRKWFGHDPKKWADFKKRYRDELKINPALKTLRKELEQHTVVTFLFAAKDIHHNNAVALADYLSTR